MRVSPRLRGSVCGLFGLLAIAAFFDAAELNGRYVHPREGVRYVPHAELVFLLWYVVWGGLAVASFATAIHVFGGGRRLSELLDSWSKRSAQVLVLAAWPLFAGILALRYWVLLNQPITDDEAVYELTARNLALGRVTSTPPIEPSFLVNQFVVVGYDRWHGKYPVGHSLLLAPFELLGRVDLLGALLALVSIALTYALARRFVGERGALLSTLLLIVSPHFLLTHATLLSQTTSCMVMLLSAYASIRHSESKRATWLWVMGAALGFGVLTRPMPMLLVAIVIGLNKSAELLHTVQSRGRVLRESLCWVIPVVGFAAFFLAANYAQSGSPWTTGYHEIHSSFGTFQDLDGELSNSLGGGLVRENVWLFGWPCSLMFVPFARLSARGRLFWGLVATGIAYRVLVPKTVVATTGPVYLTELLPWLCIASVSGIQRVGHLLERLGVEDHRSRVAATVAAGFAVAALTFWPIEVREIRRGAEARDYVYQSLFEEGVSKAVVFCESLVLPQARISWAYYAPNPWPDLRDDVLFLRVPAGADGPRRAFELWRRHFRDRPAFVYRPVFDRGELRRVPIEGAEATLAFVGSPVGERSSGP